MKTKKHPKANLENYSKLFAQLGLVLSLAIVYVLIQNKTYEKDLIVFNYNGRNIVDETPPNVLYKPEDPKPEIKPKKKVIIDIIEKVDDEKVIGETILEGIDPNAPVDLTGLVDVKEEKPIEEDVPFILLEEAPLFPGCKGSKDEKRACFIKQISKFINKKFNSDLAGGLNLPSGKQRIHTIFKIDKNGNIVDIKARSPYKKLEDEAMRVIKLLPKMTPGKQRGNAVGVKYTQPIVFVIQ